MCRVLLSEVGVGFMTNADADAWARVNGLTVEEDYLGRPSISVADAYRLREKSKRAEEEARKRAELTSRVYTAQQVREEFFEKALGAAMAQRGTSQEDAVRQALRSLKDAEKGLPREVRDQLAGPRIAFGRVS